MISTGTLRHANTCSGWGVFMVQRGTAGRIIRTDRTVGTGRTDGIGRTRGKAGKAGQACRQGVWFGGTYAR